MTIPKIRINQILAYLIVARFSCVALANIPIFGMRFIFIYGLLFIVSFIGNYRILEKREAGAIVAILLYTFVVVIKSVPVYGSIFNTQAFNSYVIIFLLFIYLYMKRIVPSEAVKIIRISLLGYIFTYLYSIVMLIQDPTLSRRAAANITTENSVDTLNAIGGFDTVYGTLIILTFLIYFYRKVPSKKDLWLVRLGIISGIVFLVLAAYGTAIVLLVMLFLLVMMKKSKVMGSLTTIAVGFFLVFKTKVGELLASFADSITVSYILKEKVEDIASMLITGESAGTLSGNDGRLARIRWDIESFTKYPIFGGLGKSDAQIGAHSEIFDILARFGILGFILIFLFFSFCLIDGKYLVHDINGKKCYTVAILLYIAIALLDPALYTQQILPFFILLPFFDDLISSQLSETGFTTITVINGDTNDS